MTHQTQARAQARYCGRFAPTPNGLLHRGSLVAALASWLDARAHDGTWLIRFDDLDQARCQAQAPAAILHQLAQFGLLPDAPPRYQSQHSDRYRAALDQLIAHNLAYPCACSRRDIALANEQANEQANAETSAKTNAPSCLTTALTQVTNPTPAEPLDDATGTEQLYPGTCRNGLQGRAPRAWRARLHQSINASTATPWHWHDRRLGDQSQDLQRQAGDFVLLRADGVWAYQLATVVDDADMGISMVVRGEDLAASTPRQMWLAAQLKLPQPHYLHTPLRRDPQGQKLGKSTGALPLLPISPTHVLDELHQALSALGLSVPHATTLAELLAQAVKAWQEKWG